MTGYPIELDLEGRDAVVVGLGPVGVRKALGLIEAGARVFGVDPDPGEIPPGLAHVPEPFRPSHLDGAALVFACASAEVNREVVQAARDRAIWVNSASEPERGDFRLPAVSRRGRLTLTVSTSGGSPGLAALIRDAANAAIGPEAEILVELIADLRAEVLARVSDPDVRRRLLLSWAALPNLELVRDRGAEAVEEAFRREIEAASNDAVGSDSSA